MAVQKSTPVENERILIVPTRRRRRVTRYTSKRRGYERRSSHTRKVLLNKENKRRGGTDYVKDLIDFNTKERKIDNKEFIDKVKMLETAKGGNSSIISWLQRMLGEMSGQNTVEADTGSYYMVDEAPEIFKDMLNAKIKNYIIYRDSLHTPPKNMLNSICNWLNVPTEATKQNQASLNNLYDDSLQDIITLFFYKLYEHREIHNAHNRITRERTRLSSIRTTSISAVVAAHNIAARDTNTTETTTHAQTVAQNFKEIKEIQQAVSLQNTHIANAERNEKLLNDLEGEKLEWIRSMVDNTRVRVVPHAESQAKKITKT